MRSRIIVDAGHRRLLPLAGELRRIKPTTVASFQFKGYVRLAILVDPTRWLAHHWLEHRGSSSVGMTVICLHIYMVIVLKDSWRLEADLMHVGTTMSVKFNTTHQSCCCCELLNLEQHISLTPSPHAVGPFPFSTCNIESGQTEATITFYCHRLLVQQMPCNAPRVLCSREL